MHFAEGRTEFGESLGDKTFVARWGEDQLDADGAARLRLGRIGDAREVQFYEIQVRGAI